MVEWECPTNPREASGLDPEAVHTGSDTNTETDIYWGQSNPVWNNDGDTVILRDDDGQLVIEETY